MEMEQDRTREMEQMHQRIHVNEQQRDQIRSCTQAAEKVRTRAMEMKQSSSRPDFSIEKARQERTQLQNEIRTMHEEHNRFMENLGNEQREQIRDRIHSMEQARDHMDSQFQKMEEEMNRAEPDRKQISTQAREIEQSMHEWQKQYHDIAE